MHCIFLYKNCMVFAREQLKIINYTYNTILKLKSHSVKYKVCPKPLNFHE